MFTVPKGPLLWLGIATGLAIALRGDEVEIIDATLPQADKLRRRSTTTAIVYHTTGRGLTRQGLKGGDPLSAAFDEAVLGWYRRSGMRFFGHAIITPRGAVYRLAPDDAWCLHAASLPKGGGPPPPAWWRARWPGLAHPVDLLGRHANVQTWAMDLVPLPTGKFTAVQLQAAAELGAQMGDAYDLPRTARYHLGHEDFDPARRGDPRPWDPGWNRARFLQLLAAA